MKYTSESTSFGEKSSVLVVSQIKIKTLNDIS